MLKNRYYIKDTLDFNGSGYTDFGIQDQYKFGTGAFSVEAWFYLPSGLADDQYSIVANSYYDNNDTYESGFELYLNTIADRIYFLLNDGSGVWLNGEGIVYCPIPSEGAWHHVVATRTGSDAANWKIYVDGVEQTTTVAFNNLSSGDISANTNENLKIGTKLNGHPSKTGYWNGSINNVRLYSREMDSAEVSANHSDNCDKVPTDTTGMVLWAKLEKGSGTSVTDYSRFEETGTFTGTGLSWGRKITDGACRSSLICFTQKYGEFLAGYRFGFNGMEKDDAIKGSGNSYDFGARIYDPRVGRWLSMDPLFREAPGWTPYRAFYDNPIFWNDPNGMLEDNFVFNESGDFERIEENDQPDKLVIENSETGNRDEYEFNDIKNDPLAIRNGEITKVDINFYETNYLDLDIEQSGANEDLNLLNTLKQGYNESLEGGNFDFSDKFAKNTLTLINGRAYNKYDAGNFMTGQALSRQGFPLSSVLLGAHLNNMKSGRSDQTQEMNFGPGTYEGYKLFDSPEDQAALRHGWYYPETPPENTSQDNSEPYKKGVCFISGTKITMADGTYSNIENIKVGDSVKTYNFHTETIENEVVLRIDSPIHKNLISIKFKNGSRNTNTFDHPYYVKGKGWCSYRPELTLVRYGIKVKTLEVGDICFNLKNGILVESKVMKIEENIKIVKTYNLSEVNRNNNFFANGILVHNKALE